MALPGEASIIYDSGWISGSALTASIDCTDEEFIGVYVAASGAGGPPVAAKIQDNTVMPITIATLVLPVANAATLNMLGPTLTGSNIANSIGYFNTIVPLRPVVQVQHSASAAAWYKVVVVGR